ncbi:MAG: large-conductance mechanosensitive channel protein MscL [Paramuribaculum sp.]|nr:large-conductance mechanosensitive channel protein MscL [Paramuribaculum sp.]
MSFIKDFKEFAMKGNIIDMAVGVIIGGAFGKIVSSLVNDIIMPCMTVITGSDGFKNMKYVIVEGKEAVAEGQAAVEEVAVNYGMFIQNIVDFLIIALSIFVALRVIVKFKRKEKEAEAEAAAAPAEPTKEEVLLTEIRDILAKEAKK